MEQPRAGQKIVVFNGQREELGEGTFIRLTRHKDMNMVAYECEEHTILARGDHYLRLDGQLHFIPA